LKINLLGQELIKAFLFKAPEFFLPISVVHLTLSEVPSWVLESSKDSASYLLFLFLASPMSKDFVGFFGIGESSKKLRIGNDCAEMIFFATYLLLSNSQIRFASSHTYTLKLAVSVACVYIQCF